MKNLCYCALEILYILVAVVDVCSIGIAGYAVSLSCGYPKFAATCIQALCLLSACVFLFSGFSVYISVKEGVPQVHVSSIKRAMRVIACFSLLTSHLLIVLSYYHSAALLFGNWRKLFVIACLCETCILFPVVFYAGFTSGNPMEYVLKYLEKQKSKRSRLSERSSVEDRTGVACIAVVAVLALLFVALMMYMKMRESHEVGLKLPNRWKLYDMQGNVDEGCLNWNSPLWYGKDPRGFSAGSDRMRRDGNWWIS